ncbi:hypothetical protein GCM10027589_08080 [Actinocorallia lasiicapitis]
MQLRHIAIAAMLPLALVTGCSSGGGAKAEQTAAQEPQGGGGGAALAPGREYLGIYTEGKTKNDPAAQAKVFKKNVGRAPNIVKHFVAWGNPYPAAWAKAAYKGGALPQLELENHGVSMASIAAGEQDEYLVKLAGEIKASGVPVMISPFHEFNGWWYSWATCNGKPASPSCQGENKKNSPKLFVKAWRHMHDVLKENGATKAKWMWSPNVVYPMPKVKLKPFYPGNGYVDWVGVIGYYKGQKNATFKGSFEPTIKQIRTFTKKPILIAETGSAFGPKRAADLKDLLTTVAKRKDIIGLIYFNMNKPGEADYRLERTKSSLKLFRSLVTKYPFGIK